MFDLLLFYCRSNDSAGIIKFNIINLILPNFSSFSTKKKNGIFECSSFFQQLRTKQNKTKILCNTILHATADTFWSPFSFTYISFVVTLAKAVNRQHVLLTTYTHYTRIYMQGHKTNNKSPIIITIIKGI